MNAFPEQSQPDIITNEVSSGLITGSARYAMLCTPERCSGAIAAKHIDQSFFKAGKIISAIVPAEQRSAVQFSRWRRYEHFSWAHFSL